MANLDLSKYGITGTTEIVHNPSYEVLFKNPAEVFVRQRLPRIMPRMESTALTTTQKTIV